MGRALRVTVVAALGAALCTGPGVASTLAAPERLTAVVSYDRWTDPGSLGSARVEVVRTYPRLDAAEIRAPFAELARLVRRPGIRGVVPDAELRPSGSSVDGAAKGVYAWEHLDEEAGRAGAGRGVTVALVDTGVSDTWGLRRSSGRLVDGVDTSGESRLTDGYGHGTFMAGIIGGGTFASGNERGVGVAPGARIVNVKVADASGTTSLTKVLAGFDWVIANRAVHSIDVASFSFSRTRPGTGYGPDPLTDAVERVREAGISIVVSAGNVPGEVGDPGFDPRVLTVGAAALGIGKPRVADFSGGAVVAGVVKPDVVASGVHMLSSLPPDSLIAQQNPGSQRRDGLWRGTGTSQATAVTAGVVAIFLAEFPGATPRQVKASVRAAATKVSGRHGGAGLVAIPNKLRDGTDGPGSGDGGGDGEGGFDAGSWSSNSWSAGSWSAGSWSSNSWSAGSWSSSSWSAGSWSRADDAK